MKIHVTEAQRALSEKQTAIYIGMSRSYLRQDRMNGIRDGRTPGPRFVKVGRTIRYLKDDLDKWLEKNLVSREVSHG